MINRVLVIQDTTELVYTQFPSIADIGELNKAAGFDSGVAALRLHSSLAVTESRVPLGILKQSYFTHEDYRKNRDPGEKNRKGANKKPPIANKQSYRWIQHFHATNEMAYGVNVKPIHVENLERLA